jgi:hypothetical protein
MGERDIIGIGMTDGIVIDSIDGGLAFLPGSWGGRQALDARLPPGHGWFTANLIILPTTAYSHDSWRRVSCLLVRITMHH